MPTLGEHLAARASPLADLVVEAMCARGTQVAGLAVVGGEVTEAYGWSGICRLAALYGRRPSAIERSTLGAPGEPWPPAVFVITDHCAGWVSVRQLADAAALGAA